jgi:hypothetical protein
LAHIPTLWDLSPVSERPNLGAEFARALAAKDRARMLELIHPEVASAG